MLKLGPLYAFLLIAAALVAGCGGDDPGTPPAISDLSYAPDSGAAGQAATITGQFTFSDPEGDLDSVTIEVTGPNDLAQTIGPQAIQGAAGVTSGPVGVTLMLNPPVAGAYTFTVWVTDAAGNDSNPLSGTYTAQ